MMFDQGLDPREDALPALSKAGRFIISPQRAALVLCLSYASSVFLVAVFLSILEDVQGYDDNRNIHVTVIFAILLALPFVWALIGAFRRPRLPDFQRRLTTP